MTRQIILIFLSAVSIASSQDDKLQMNEFRFLGGALACLTDTVSDSYSPCLRIGFIQIGDPYEPIESKFGRPNEIMPRKDGKEIRVFELKSKSEEMTYLAITVLNEKVNAIQIAGEPPEEPMNFSSVGVGDSPALIIKLLGKPSSFKLVEKTGATLWSYAPFPFSFEIMDKKVFSIKVWQP